MLGVETLKSERAEKVWLNIDVSPVLCNDGDHVAFSDSSKPLDKRSMMWDMRCESWPGDSGGFYLFEG